MSGLLSRSVLQPMYDRTTQRREQNHDIHLLFPIVVVVVAVAVAVPAVPDNQSHVMSKPVIVADPNKGVKVDAAVVAKPFREEIQKQVKELKEQGIGTYKCLEIKDSR